MDVSTGEIWLLLTLVPNFSAQFQAKFYVFIRPCHVARRVQIVGQFPQRALVHHGVAYVAQRRHCQPVGPVVGVVHPLVVEKAVVGNYRELVRLSVYALHPHVVVAQRAGRVVAVVPLNLHQLQIHVAVLVGQCRQRVGIHPFQPAIVFLQSAYLCVESQLLVEMVARGVICQPAFAV